jgi:hypothetical protein
MALLPAPDDFSLLREDLFLHVPGTAERHVKLADRIKAWPYALAPPARWSAARAGLPLPVPVTASRRASSRLVPRSGRNPADPAHEIRVNGEECALQAIGIFLRGAFHAEAAMAPTGGRFSGKLDTTPAAAPDVPGDPLACQAEEDPPEIRIRAAATATSPSRARRIPLAGPWDRGSGRS